MITADNVSNIDLIDLVEKLDRNELNADCQRWALAHGFVQRYFSQNESTQQDSIVIPYPFTIYPTFYPRDEYQRAYRIQSGINHFVQHLAFDIDLMDSVFKNLIEFDPFIKRLREIYDQSQRLPYRSDIETCIIRTDYMLQQMNNIHKKTKLRLIELNTIAVGLGAAAKLMHLWHKRLLTRIQPALLSQLPENESHDLVIDTLYQSWIIYNNPKAIILFIIPEREFNIGDQMLIDYGLSSHENLSALVKQVTYLDISENCSLDSQGVLYFGDFEVALVYYRTGYDPKHFYDEKIWQTYLLLESSRAIKCPSLRYHLAGMKCFQFELIKQTFLEEIFREKKQYIDDFRDITEEMFTIDQVINDPILQQRIHDKPDSFYLKQSREGGGNVYCGSLLKEHLDQIISTQQSNRYFLMSRIYPPIHTNFICSFQKTNKNEIICKQKINSELGIFSGLISRNGIIIYERIAGSLLRSKSTKNIEGGIASGQGCIDSILLI